MGRTLWDRMTGANKPVAVEAGQADLQFQNPAQVKVGGVLTLNVLDLRDLLFTVLEIQNWTRLVNGNKRVFTDYKLLARPHDGEDIEVILRMIPIENPDTVAKLTHNCVALKKFFECSWSDEDERAGLMEGVSDPKGKLVWMKDTPEEKVFWRINGLEAFDCAVDIMDAHWDTDETRTEKYKLWDYFCKIQKDGQEVTEFLYVHQDQDAKDFAVWIGEEIDLTRIS